MVKRSELTPTMFHGVTYRSRIEARWAVFFDRLGVSFQYEPKSFKLEFGQEFTSSFSVHEFDAYIKVFPDSTTINIDEAELAFEFYKGNHEKCVWLAFGPPDAETTNILDFSHVDADPEIDVTTYKSVSEFIHFESIRYKFLEDRKDKFIYWLGNDDESHVYSIGGPGAVSDKEKWPLIHRNVEAAYLKSARAFNRGRIEEPW